MFICYSFYFSNLNVQNAMMPNVYAVFCSVQEGLEMQLALVYGISGNFVLIKLLFCQMQ